MQVRLVWMLTWTDCCYSQVAFGDCAGFLYMWAAMWIVFPAANAAIAVTCAQYLLYPVFPSCQSPELARRFIAAAAICKTKHISSYIHTPSLLSRKISFESWIIAYLDFRWCVVLFIPVLLTFVNCLSVRLATKIQDVFMVIKVFALVMIIITGIVALITSKPY